MDSENLTSLALSRLTNDTVTTWYDFLHQWAQKIILLWSRVSMEKYLNIFIKVGLWTLSSAIRSYYFLLHNIEHVEITRGTHDLGLRLEYKEIPRYGTILTHFGLSCYRHMLKLTCRYRVKNIVITSTYSLTQVTVEPRKCRNVTFWQR